MIKQGYLLLLLASLLAGGCNTVRDRPVENAPGGDRPAETTPSPQIATNETHAVTRSDSLLMYFGYVRKLQAAELAKEYEAIRQSYVASRTDFNRLRYAMVLSVPGSTFYDDARALDAIDPLVRNQNSALHTLAFMVNAQIQEQRRAQGLQQKLDALKSLEKSLIERDTGGVKRK